MLNEADLVKYVTEKLDTCKKEAYELQGYLNLSYFAGKQWVTLDTPTGRIVEPPKESWQIRYVANKVQPIVRTEGAKITKNKFIMFVAPATNDDSDIKSARIADKIVSWLDYELALQEKDRENCLWGLTTGAGFMKPFWNPSKGLEVAQGLHQGDVDACVVSLFELKWDSSASKWEDVRWLCHEKVRDVDYIKKVYGKEVKPEDGLTVTNIYEAKLQNLNTLGEGIQYKNQNNSAVVKEFWEKPSSEYPMGRRITVCNDVLLFYEEDIGFGETDDTERELPFFPFFNINVPGRLIPTSVTEQLLPIQREYNKTRSQIIENKNLMGNPIWIIPDGSMDEDEEPTNRPGGVYKYVPINGYKPEMVTPPAMSADVYKNLELCDTEFEFVSGQHETSHGTTPTGVTSGTAIGYLQEQDDTRLSMTIANFITCKQKYMRYLLKMVQKKYDTERTVKIVGQNQRTEVMTFKGADLTSIDVRVNEGTMNQMSRAAKQDWIIKLCQYGILNPQTDKQMILKMLELGITEDVFDEFEIDAAQAQGENSQWQNGDFTPDVRDFYNHAVHIKEHNKFRKEEVYRNMPPELQQAIDQHVDQHANFYAMQIIPQMNPEPQGGGRTTPTTPQEQPRSDNPDNAMHY